MGRLAQIELTERFKKDFDGLDPQTQARVKEIIEQDLLPWPSKRSLRHHTLNGYKPPIHVIDVTSNHSHQITFTCDGTTCRLLRVAKHKHIDRSPE